MCSNLFKIWFYPLVDFVQKAQIYQIPAKGIPFKTKEVLVCNFPMFHTNPIKPVVWPPKDLIPPFSHPVNVQREA